MNIESSFFPLSITIAMPPPEEASTSTQTFPSAAFRRLVAHVLHDTGFDAATPAALSELEDQTLLRTSSSSGLPLEPESDATSIVLGGICHLAKELSSVSRRTRPIPVDFQSALLEQGLPLSDLRGVLSSNKRARPKQSVSRSSNSEQAG
jgi:hypothetical protein